MTAPTDALTELHPDLLRLALILTRNPDRAEDLAQEVFANVLARLTSGDEITDLRPYLMAALRNAHRRAARALPQDSIDEADLPTHPPEGQSRLMCRDVLRAVADLPPPQAELILLLITTEDSFAGLAARTGLPLGTVCSRIGRARARLRDTLELPEGAVGMSR